ncbi:hypothetical protein CWC20_15440 [Pseudoalteromonas aurantia]|uniref:Nudix hydrolase domain-containing protein n=1 Tax=Pseudoalteromonas aurantia TaxID=43654 RepID=A0ABY2VUU1_9GAMM|nr:hypothetical protein CWC20_15440 [Pseudoalteromonas aurantia]
MQALFQFQTINQLSTNIHCNVLKFNMLIIVYDERENYLVFKRSNLWRKITLWRIKAAAQQLYANKLMNYI